MAEYNPIQDRSHDVDESNLESQDWDDEPDDDEKPCNNCGRKVNMYEEPIFPMLGDMLDPPTNKVYYLCRECVHAIEMV